MGANKHEGVGTLKWREVQLEIGQGGLTWKV